MSDTVRIKKLMTWGPKTEGDEKELLHLLLTSESPIAAQWREDQAAIRARSAKECEALRKQGRMTKERRRYLVLRNTPLCELSDDEHEELHRLTEKSDCPEAKADRARTVRLVERARRMASETKARLADAGVGMKGMTPDEERLGYYFGCTPHEIEHYIITRQLSNRGLATLPEADLAATRCDADKERRQQENRVRIARKGAAATPSHYKDDEIETAFANYRDKHPESTAWDAAQALTRKGCALSKWKGENAGPNCYKRFERLARNRYEVTAAEHYATLKKH